MSTEIEHVELVNEYGEVSGHIITRIEAKQKRPELLQKGLYMPIVTAVVVTPSGRVLAHRRGIGGHTLDAHSGVLENVTGGLPYGMTPEDAVRKEIKEETGVSVENLRFVEAKINENKFYQQLFVGTTTTTDEELSALFHETPDETIGVDFFSVSELYEKQKSGEEEFVNGFFHDLEAAQQVLSSEQHDSQ